MSHAGQPCPANPRHGRLLDLGDRAYCPHHEHDGRARSHPLGESPRTPAFFDEAEPAPRQNGRNR